MRKSLIQVHKKTSSHVITSRTPSFASTMKNSMTKMTLTLAHTRSAEEEERNAKANNNKFSVNILIRCSTLQLTQRDAEPGEKGFVCLHCALMPHLNCLKTREWGHIYTLAIIKLNV